MGIIPDAFSVLIIFQLNDIVECSVDARGTQAHANAVMKRASGLFSCLTSKNRFRPKVLAQVSLNGVFFVGSSMSVSPFLRPLCLYNRIRHFKRELKRAIAFSTSLCIADNEGMSWSSSAYQAKLKEYNKQKSPCKKCQIVFKNLKGFIDCDDVLVDGDDYDDDCDSYWGACAEYCPVNGLLLDDSEASSGADSEMFKKLKIHMNRCSVLFRDYREIADKCFDAHESGDIKKMEDIYHEVRSKIHIFGYKPQCKM